MTAYKVECTYSIYPPDSKKTLVRLSITPTADEQASPITVELNYAGMKYSHLFERTAIGQSESWVFFCDSAPVSNTEPVVITVKGLHESRFEVQRNKKIKFNPTIFSLYSRQSSKSPMTLPPLYISVHNNLIAIRPVLALEVAELKRIMLEIVPTAAPLDGPRENVFWFETSSMEAANNSLEKLVGQELMRRKVERDDLTLRSVPSPSFFVPINLSSIPKPSPLATPHASDALHPLYLSCRDNFLTLQPVRADELNHLREVILPIQTDLESLSKEGIWQLTFPSAPLAYLSFRFLLGKELLPGRKAVMDTDRQASADKAKEMALDIAVEKLEKKWGEVFSALKSEDISSLAFKYRLPAADTWQLLLRHLHRHGLLMEHTDENDIRCLFSQIGKEDLLAFKQFSQPEGSTLEKDKEAAQLLVKIGGAVMPKKDDERKEVKESDDANHSVEKNLKQ